MTSYEVETRGRTKKAVWTVAELNQTTNLLAILSVHHSLDRKQFWASLQQEKEESREGGWVTRSFWCFSNVIVAKEPVARYSAKARDAFFEKALAIVNQEIMAGNEAVIGLFENKEEAA